MKKRTVPCKWIFADVAQLKKIDLRGRSADRWGDSSSISSPIGDQKNVNINIGITITIINIVTVIITFLLLYIYKNFNLLPDDAVVGRQPLCSRITFVESSLKQDILGIVEDHYNHFNYNHKWWWWFCLIISALWWPWPCDSPMDQRVRYDFLVGHRQRQKLYTNSFSNSKITAEDKHIFFW